MCRKVASTRGSAFFDRGALPRSLLLIMRAVFILFALVATRNTGTSGTGNYKSGGGILYAAAAAPSAASSFIETELIAIDLGHENMKIGAWRVQEEDVHIKSGGTGTATTTTTSITGTASMVLNDQANRKSPPCVAFRFFKNSAGFVMESGMNSTNADGENERGLLHPPGYQLERTFAEQAQALAPRFPTQVICSPAQLLGYTLSNTTSTPASAATAATSLPPYQLTEDQLSASYSFHVRSIQQQQQCYKDHVNTKDSKGTVEETRQALGVFVPFFATSTTDAPHEGSFYSAEELTAMLLGYARQIAEKVDAADNTLSDEDERQLLDLLSSTSVADTVDNTNHLPQQQMLRGYAVPRYAALTIPIHATVAQRQALTDAAALAGLRVVRLVHSTTGAAVQLAYLKGEQVFTTDRTQFIMVYDMGSQQAEVAVYSFAAVPAHVTKRVKQKYKGSVELKALVGSRTLGGAAFDECVAAQWDALYFNQSILPGIGRATTELERRSAAKQRGSLLRAAHKAKETLSVNQETYITLDGVHADLRLFNEAAQQQLQQRVVSITPDGLLSLRYARSDFEKMCQPLFDAAVHLRDAAIAATNGLVANVGALDRFEVIGGCTRIPLLLQRLSEGYRSAESMVDRTLNSDEAAVIGTTLLSVATAPRALQLRGVSQTVPQYRVREWLTNSVYMSISANGDDNEGKEKEPKHSQRQEESVGSEKVYLRLLFPAYKTILPAIRSVRVRLSTSDDAIHDEGELANEATVRDSVLISLFSGAEADKAYQKRASVIAAEAKNSLSDNNHNNNTTAITGEDLAVPFPASVTACASCYVRTYIVHGIVKAEATLNAQVQRQHPGKAVVLGSAELVVEAVATVSGIPHCNVAYLRASYHVSPFTTTTPTTGLAGIAAATDSPSGTFEVEELDEKAKGGEEMTAVPGKDRIKQDAKFDAEGHENNKPSMEINTKDHTAAAAAFSRDANHQPENMEDVVEVKLTALTLSPATFTRAITTTRGGDGPAALQSYNMNRAELLRSHMRVRRLQKMDAARLRRSTLRNDIQSAIVWVKDQPAWSIAEEEKDENIQKKEKSKQAAPAGGHALPASWRDTVRGIGEWLDDYGETAGAAELEERLKAMKSIKTALRAI